MAVSPSPSAVQSALTSASSADTNTVRSIVRRDRK